MPKTVILLGPFAYLHRVGIGIYAHDWITSVWRLEQKWGMVQVYPVVPILLVESEIPSELVRELMKLTTWLMNV
jgi:hypothetical protein